MANMDLDEFKRRLHQDITRCIHEFEAQTGQTINDIELAFYPIPTADDPHKHLLNEIYIGLVNKDGV